MRSRFLKHFVSLLGTGLGLSATAAASVTYVAQTGDTLSTVAREFVPGPVWGKRGSLHQVVSLNPEIKNPNLIYPGQNIFLPGVKLGQTNSEPLADLLESACKTAHSPGEIVQSGDKLSKIVGRWIAGPVWGKNGSFTQVLALNPQIKNPDLIYPGQEIHVPNGQTILMQADGSLCPSSESASSSTPKKPKPTPDSNRVPADVVLAEPPKESSAAVAVKEKNSDDGSGTELEFTPFLGMTTLSSTDLTSGTKDSLASSVDAGFGARYSQSWNESFQTFERGRLNYVSFSKPTNSVEGLDSASKLLTTIGFGASEAISSRFHLSETFDLDQNLFIRADSSTSVTTDSILIPTLGAQVFYDLVQLNAFALALSLNYSEKMKASTNAYSVGLGHEVGGIIEVRQRKSGEDMFAVDLGTSYRSQDTSLTTQSETTYTLSVRFFFPVSKPAKNEDGGK